MWPTQWVKIQCEKTGVFLCNCSHFKLLQASSTNCWHVKFMDKNMEELLELVISSSFGTDADDIFVE